MHPIMRPADIVELSRIVSEANATGTAIEVMGAGSRRSIGRPSNAAVNVSTKTMRGISLYEPGECVMTVRSGTPVVHVEAQLAAHGQMLAFEPIDIGPMIGVDAGQATMGGVLATNLSGCRRISSGAVRDWVIGLSGVSGQGETFGTGGRVVKNSTGFNLARTMSGSWGTLGIFTEIAFKVVPAPEETATLLFLGLPDEIAVEVLSAALATPYEVSGTVHLHEKLVERIWHEGIRGVGQAVTAIRIENFSRLVNYRKAKLIDELAAFGAVHELDHENSLSFWGELRQLSPFCGSSAPVWRISTSPGAGPKIVQALSGYMDCNAYYDWSGGLIWLEVLATSDASAADIRRAVAIHGGHATLIRADQSIREMVEVFQPLDRGVARLMKRIKDSFDPNGLLNPGRMYHAL